MVTVATTFGPDGYGLYARRALDLFAAHWHSSYALRAYVEEPVELPCGEARDFWRVPGVRGFLERHGALDERGRWVPDAKVAGNERQPIWRDSEVRAGHSFRTDAWKFFRKPLVVADAACRAKTGVLVWLDADVMTRADVPAGFVDTLLGDCDVAYLGRAGTHSECGFLAFRLPAAFPVIYWWAMAYAGDAVFRMPEWHDSYVFDRAREACPNVRCRNLTPGGYGHTWSRSPLALYLDHLKGAERKRLGFDPQEGPELKRIRDAARAAQA